MTSQAIRGQNRRLGQTQPYTTMCVWCGADRLATQRGALLSSCQKSACRRSSLAPWDRRQVSRVRHYRHHQASGRQSPSRPRERRATKVPPLGQLLPSRRLQRARRAKRLRLQLKLAGSARSSAFQSASENGHRFRKTRGRPRPPSNRCLPLTRPSMTCRYGTALDCALAAETRARYRGWKEQKNTSTSAFVRARTRCCLSRRIHTAPHQTNKKNQTIKNNK